jgi:hypothetical protein
MSIAHSREQYRSPRSHCRQSHLLRPHSSLAHRTSRNVPPCRLVGKLVASTRTCEARTSSPYTPQACHDRRLGAVTPGLHLWSVGKGIVAHADHDAHLSGNARDGVTGGFNPPRSWVGPWAPVIPVEMGPIETGSDRDGSPSTKPSSPDLSAHFTRTSKKEINAAQSRAPVVLAQPTCADGHTTPVARERRAGSSPTRRSW